MIQGPLMRVTPALLLEMADIVAGMPNQDAVVDHGRDERGEECCRVLSPSGLVVNARFGRAAGAQDWQRIQ